MPVKPDTKPEPTNTDTAVETFQLPGQQCPVCNRRHAQGIPCPQCGYQAQP